MIVEDDHKSYFCERLDSDIEYFHACFADQLGVGGEVLSGDWFVIIIEL
jgi:hypothetical protein